MKLSARNILKGKIISIKKGATTTHVKIDIGGQIMMSAITNEAVDELKLSEGQTAYAVTAPTNRRLYLRLHDFMQMSYSLLQTFPE